MSYAFSHLYLVNYFQFYSKHFMTGIRDSNTMTTRQSEMANTSPATCQCLATFTPLKSKMLIFLCDVISLLAQVVILLIDTAT